MPAKHLAAMGQGQVLYLSPFKAHQRRSTVQMAAYQNLFAATLADMVFVAYAHPGSKSDEFCREVLGWGKTVYTMESDLNANLLDPGAKPVKQSVVADR